MWGVPYLIMYSVKEKRYGRRIKLAKKFPIPPQKNRIEKKPDIMLKSDFSLFYYTKWRILNIFRGILSIPIPFHKSRRIFNFKLNITREKENSQRCGF